MGPITAPRIIGKPLFTGTLFMSRSVRLTALVRSTYGALYRPFGAFCKREKNTAFLRWMHDIAHGLAQRNTLHSVLHTRMHATQAALFRLNDILTKCL
ncbi:hypothetical protein PSP6_410010 [Paraburkholderia tropica]|nr:hypothetical protein PSP6_410010 [Paraburkholderia tropica]